MSKEHSQALVEGMSTPTMLRPRITRVNQSFTLEFEISEGVTGSALTDDLLAVLKKHAPKEPEPGQVTRNGFASVISGLHVSWEDSNQEAWAAAEAAAREGYVSKAEVLKVLDNYNLARPETCDLVDVICEIRELVK